MDEGKPKRGRPKLAGGTPEAKRKRQAYDRKRNARKIFIEKAFDRWEALRSRLGSITHQALAFRLINRFENATSTPRNRGKKPTFDPSDVTSISSVSTDGWGTEEMMHESAKDNEELPTSSLSKLPKADTSFIGTDLNNTVVSVELPELEDGDDHDDDPTWHPEDIEFAMVHTDPNWTESSIPSVKASEAVFDIGRKNPDNSFDDEFDEYDSTVEEDESGDDEAGSVPVDVNTKLQSGVMKSVTKEDICGGMALCFINSLVELANTEPLKCCQKKGCVSPVQLSWQRAGTAVHLLWKCNQGHEMRRWTS